MTSNDEKKIPAVGTGTDNPDNSQEKQASNATKQPLSGAAAAKPTQPKSNKFVTPVAANLTASSPILCPRYGHVIPTHVLEEALEKGTKIRSYYAGTGGVNPADATSSTRSSKYTHEELKGAVFRLDPAFERAASTNKPKNQPIVVQGHSSDDDSDSDNPIGSPDQSAQRSKRSVSPNASKSKKKPRTSKVAEKTQSPQAQKRNSKEMNQDQIIALLTEVVEGETYIMAKNKRGFEERTLVSRAKGIPHGKTNAYWDAIIEKLQSKHYQVTKAGAKPEPLFALALKKDYVSGHFDKLVNKRLAEKERRRSSAGSGKSFGVLDEDFETGEGDDSEHEDDEEGKMVGSAAKSDDRLKSNKAKQSHIDELLDAYLIQQRAHKAEVEAASLFVQEENTAGSKRPSGQENEHSDNALIEDTANGGKKKKKEKKEKHDKLPKLAMPSQVERSQAASLDHANSMSSGFHALAESQKPSSVEEFKQKSAALVDQIGKTVAETATQAINAWSKYKSSARACVSEGGVHDWLTLREEPLRMVCKVCGNVIG